MLSACSALRVPQKCHIPRTLCASFLKNAIDNILNIQYSNFNNRVILTLKINNEYYTQRRMTNGKTD
jgi:hypothetical protein